jgi:tartrate-resistant acid phosphatase type 5
MMVLVFTLTSGYCQVPVVGDVSKNFKSVEKALQFYLFGDFGRNGEEHQKDLAVMMDKAAHQVEPAFIISTGDNFYPDGVASTQDPVWMSSFENIYTGQALHCLWNVVLGNHDYLGSVQAQIDYSKISRRWNMPARYFSESLRSADGAEILFVYIDSNPLQNNYYTDKYRSTVISQDTTRQLKWIDSVLSKSNARWKFVIGHHPLYTAGRRIEDISYMRKHLENIFAKNNVDAYLCGHDHTLQYIKPAGNTHYFISGTGSEVLPVGKLSPTKFAASIEGFMAFSVTQGATVVQVLDYHGALVYQTEIKK